MGSSSTNKPTRLSTNYYTGTIMDPSVILPLRASFQEYDDLGAKHREITNQIQNLQGRMSESRKSGAFKVLQDQMAKIKTLVKEREDIDAKMSVLDLARKKQDDFNIARQVETSFSEKIESVEEQIANLEHAFESFTETFDFARCQRPDGSFYGTRGKCKKGVEAGAKEDTKTSGKGPSHVDLVTPRQPTQSDVDRVRKYRDEQETRLKNQLEAIKKNPEFAKDPEVQKNLEWATKNRDAANSELSRLSKSVGEKGTSSKSKSQLKVEKLKEGFEKAKADLKSAKDALKALKGRDKRSRVGRQELKAKLYEAEMRFGKMRNDLVSAVNKARAK